MQLELTAANFGSFAGRADALNDQSVGPLLARGVRDSNRPGVIGGRRRNTERPLRPSRGIVQLRAVRRVVVLRRDVHKQQKATSRLCSNGGCIRATTVEAD